MTISQRLETRPCNHQVWSIAEGGLTLSDGLEWVLPQYEFFKDKAAVLAFEIGTMMLSWTPKQG